MRRFYALFAALLSTIPSAASGSMPLPLAHYAENPCSLALLSRKSVPFREVVDQVNHIDLATLSPSEVKALIRVSGELKEWISNSRFRELKNASEVLDPLPEHSQILKSTEVHEPKFVVRKTEGQPKLYLVGTGGGDPVFVTDLFVMKAGTKIFHWIRPDGLARFEEHGMSEEDMESLISRNDGRSKGGLYVSLDPWDSSTYGNAVLVGEQEQDILVAPWVPVGPFSRQVSQKNGPLGPDEFGTTPDLIRALRQANVPVTLDCGNDVAKSLEPDGTKNRWLVVRGTSALGNFHQASADEMRSLLLRSNPPYPEEVELRNLIAAQSLAPVPEPILRAISSQYPLIRKLLNSEQLTNDEIGRLARSDYLTSAYYLLPKLSIFDLKNWPLARSYLNQVLTLDIAHFFRQSLQYSASDKSNSLITRSEAAERLRFLSEWEAARAATNPKSSGQK